MILTDSPLIDMGLLQTSGLLIYMMLSSSSGSVLEICEIAEVFRRLLKYGQKKSHFDKRCVHLYPPRYMSYTHTNTEISAGRQMEMGLCFPLAIQNYCTTPQGWSTLGRASLLCSRVMHLHFQES